MDLSIEWLNQSVPLWAFLVAMLTKPYTWSKELKKLIKEKFKEQTE